MGSSPGLVRYPTPGNNGNQWSYPALRHMSNLPILQQPGAHPTYTDNHGYAVEWNTGNLKGVANFGMLDGHVSAWRQWPLIEAVQRGELKL
jgi:prepilin-type processing-associated H-X9-DG protein